MKCFQFYREKDRENILYEVFPKSRCWRCLRSNRKKSRNCQVVFQDFTQPWVGSCFNHCLLDIIRAHVSPRDISGLHYRIVEKKRRNNPTLEELFFEDI